MFLKTLPVIYSFLTRLTIRNTRTSSCRTLIGWCSGGEASMTSMFSSTIIFCVDMGGLSSVCMRIDPAATQPQPQHS